MNNIWKEFPGVKALKGVSIKVYEGEIVGLVGENGAGKSTLLKILTGVYKKDKGEIIWLGKSVEIPSPHVALDLGIGYVPQEIELAWNLSVVENIFLGRERKRLFSRKDLSKELEKAKNLLKSLGLEIDPSIKAKYLSVAQQQLVMVARALAHKVKLIAFDEPTSALGPREAEHLLSIMRKLKENGVSVIFVSHRIEEVMSVADRIYVLRDGALVAEYDLRKQKVDMKEIIKAMIAREVKEFFPKEKVEIGDVIFEVRNLSNDKVKDVSFYVRRGEILGIFGIVGAGRTEMAQTIIGYRPKKRGEIYLEGKKVEIKKPIDAIKLGIGYLPEDRRLLGLILLLTVKDNTTLSVLDEIRRLKLGMFSKIDGKKEMEIVREMIKELRIVPPDPIKRVMYLSGGNQQKVVLAKLLASRAKVLILDEPTRGIDVGAKVEIRKLMNRLVKEGKAIILISSELPEIMGMSDRILVMSSGRIVAEFTREEATEEKIMEAAIAARPK